LLREEGNRLQLDPFGKARDVNRNDRRSRAPPEQDGGKQQGQSPYQRLIQLTKLKMLVAHSRSVMMKITRNSTIMPTTPAPAGA